MKTIEYIDASDPGKPGMCWIGIGWGHRRLVDKFKVHDFNYDYDPIYSWTLGADINSTWRGNQGERFGPWNRVPTVAFYAEPWGRVVNFHKHFVAYVLGAHGIQSLTV